MLFDAPTLYKKPELPKKIVDFTTEEVIIIEK